MLRNGRRNQKTQHGIETYTVTYERPRYVSRRNQKTQHGIETNQAWGCSRCRYGSQEPENPARD